MKLVPSVFDTDGELASDVSIASRALFDWLVGGSIVVAVLLLELLSIRVASALMGLALLPLAAMGCTSALLLQVIELLIWLNVSGLIVGMAVGC